MPISMMMIAITQAKIGRSMKIFDMLLSALSPVLHRPGRRSLDALWSALRHRLDRCAVLEVRSALRDHLFAGRQASGHHPVHAERSVRLDGALHRAITRADDK